MSAQCLQYTLLGQVRSKGCEGIKKILFRTNKRNDKIKSKYIRRERCVVGISLSSEATNPKAISESS